jgi:hypothetical protein
VKIYKVSFELVNAVKHPDYYCGHGCGEHPATDASTIPDERSIPQKWFVNVQHQYVAGRAPGVCYHRMNDGAICGGHEGAEIHNV